MAEAVKQAPQARHADPDPYDAYEEPVKFLKSRDWRCLGSVQGAGWLDPTCPDVPTQRLVKRQAPDWKTGQLEDVVADDGTGKKVVVHQTVCEFPAEPMPIQQALRIQIDRDSRAMLERARREKKAA